MGIFNAFLIVVVMNHYYCPQIMQNFSASSPSHYQQPASPPLTNSHKTSSTLLSFTLNPSLQLFSKTLPS